MIVKSPFDRQFVQTSSYLEIKSQLFEISLPGSWTEEKSRTVEAVFQGRSGNRWVSVTVFHFVPGLSLEGRKRGVQDILNSRKEVEHRLSGGDAEVELAPPYESDGLVYGSALSTNHSMGLVSFTRLIANDESVISIYWQVDGFNEPPPLTELWKEFEEVIATVCIA
jgi:hypothetical protein